jgi:hypothetical protein
MRMAEDDISRTSLPKIGLLVEDAKAELKLAGIETDGKRSDEILKMAREERNRPVKGPNRHRGPNLPSLVFDGGPR